MHTNLHFHSVACIAKPHDDEVPGQQRQNVAELVPNRAVC